MFETHLYNYLSQAGTSASARVYPRRLPQGVTLPAITYALVSSGIEYQSAGQSSLETPRYQLDCWGATYLAAKTLAEELKARLSGFRGQMGTKTVTAAFIEGEREDDDPETQRECVSLDVIIHHQ